MGLTEIKTSGIADDAVTTDKLASNISLGELAVTGDVHFNSATNAGKDVYWDESASELQFSDTTYATFGAGKDLKIFHDASGTRNLIQSTTTSQDLYIAAEEGEIYIQTDYGASNSIACLDNGGVNLYYDNTKRFHTTSTGAIITSERFCKFKLGFFNYI